ncbi:kunitz-type protease inhibitor 2 [Clarias gariepinus]|uniref:kunitz-type protease inhibitor 2 n=1 Tax=Clarias gariepinus TaxID=13013 RepID=UPI00234E2237|nr:kunitz-type protease inhibitor 2 [Clarias gariepinus]
MIRVLVLALVCLLGTGLVQGQNGCEFTELNQGLSPDSLANQDHLVDISDVQKCQDVCCTRDDCQLALIETPADGSPQCFLLNCIKDGKDVCVFEASTSSKVYRKTNVSRDYCRLEKAVGHCRAAFPRFYYDVTDQTCKAFVYGGCGGNSNNFNSVEDCQNACGGVTGNALTETSASSKSRKSLTQETADKSDAALPEMSSEEYAEKCLAGAEVGLCRASIVRYYYTSGTCKRFRYGGCGGNKNNYNSEEECMNTCTVKVVDSKKTDEDREACFVPADAGPCRAAFRMFYYEPRTQSCREFIYGGCRGNKNRYSTPEECMSNCAGKEGGFGEHGEHRGRWTPAFFLVTTLAIMSVVLLVGLLVISVRRVKHQRLLLLDDKQELLPEEHIPEEVHSDH